MTNKTQIRLIRLLALFMGLVTITSLVAQDVTEIPFQADSLPTLVITSETLPTNVPPLVVTIETPPTDVPPLVVPSETLPTDIPPLVVTIETPPTDVPPLVVPSETLPTDVPPLVILSETPTLVVPQNAALPSEPALKLILRDLFQDGLVPAHWAFPPGWTIVASSPDSAVQINGTGRAVLNAIYENIAVMSYFTFADSLGTAHMGVRESALGTYQVTLDAAGAVTLNKYDAAGTMTGLGHVSLAPVPMGTARSVRLSAMNDVLRVAVDNVDVIVVLDAEPLPTGSVSIGALFPEMTNGTLVFDNVFLWAPENETQAVVLAPTGIPSTSNTNGKSTVFRAAPLAVGVLATGNDDFAGRLNASAVPYAHSGDTGGNSNQINEPTPLCGFNITNTAWYEFTPPAGGPTSETFVLTSFGSAFDTIIAVYTDGNGGTPNLADLTPVAGGCSDDVPTSQQAQLTMTFNDNTTYYIQLGGYNGSVGSFALALLRPVGMPIPTAPLLSAAAAGAPNTPVLNAGKTNLLQPFIAWAASGTITPYSYDVQVAINTAFTTPAATLTVLEPARYAQITPVLPEPALPNGQLYYWRVRARNFLGQTSAWSAVYSFTLDRVAPGAPTLTAPALNTVIPTQRPAFTWTALPDVTRYALRVATNDTCTTPVSAAFEVNVISTTTYTFAVPLPQGEYWFCVSAQDTAGNISGFSGEKRRFVVNIALTPVHNAVVVPAATATTAPITFTWTAAVGTNYTLQVDNNGDFSSPEVNQTLTSAAFTIPAQVYGTYHWRVRVNGDLLPAILARRVTVTPKSPLAVAIQMPSSVPNAGFTNDTTPFFDWTVPANWVTPPAGQSLTYELQVSTNNTFTALVVPTLTGLTSSNYQWALAPLPDTSGTLYYWRVRAMTSLGVYGAYSAVYSFTVDTTAPNPPPLTAPVDGSVTAIARPTFSWAAAPGANGYTLELSSTADFSTLSYGSPYQAVTTSLALPVSLPQGLNPLYWRIRAKDAAGNISVPGVARTLRVDYAVAPLDGHSVSLVGTAVSAPMMFSWTPVTGLTGAVYKVTIYTEADNIEIFSASGPLATAAWTSAPLGAGDYWWTVSVSGGTMGISKPRRFVISAMPGVPNASFLPPNVPTNDTTPTFNWAAPLLNPTSVIDYQLQISTVATFATQALGSPYVVTPAQLPFSITTPLPDTAGQIYYWRVRARTALNAYGPFTAAQAFTLDTTQPSAPTGLTLPTENAVLKTARPAFSWMAAAGVKFYKIHIDTENTFTAPVLHEATSLTAAYTSTLSLPQGRYFWRIWSMDAAGSESLTPSVTGTFLVEYAISPIVNTVIPTATTANVIFTWSPVIAAPLGTTYTIEIDTNANGTPETSLSPVTTATTTASALPHGDYQYRLVVSNGFGTSGWTRFVISPLLPSAPTAPFAPLNTPTNDVTPTLQWTAPATNTGNVTGYVVQVSTIATFATQISGSPFQVGNATTFTLPMLPNTAGQVYYWRVQARGAFNTLGAYSATQAFTLDTTAPAAPASMNTPLDNAVTSSSRPAFSWAASAGANRYVFQLTQDGSDFNPLVFPEVTTTLASFAIPTTTSLTQGTYVWRVWAKDAAGNLSAFPSPVRTLHVNYSLTPAANAVIVSAAPAAVTFTWAAVSGTAAQTIRVQIDNNSDFSSPIRTSPLLPVTAITYTTSLAGSTPGTTPLPFGQYYWRVIITGHANWPSALARRFTISPAASPSPSLVTTTPTASSADTTPDFAWNAVVSPIGATITGYEFQLSILSTFTTLVGPTVTTSATSHTWSPTLPDSAAQVYYARVRAMTNLGTSSAWSAVRSFTLDTSAPLAAPVLIAPLTNGSVTMQQPTFQWNAVIGAARYEIRYATQPNLSALTPVSVTELAHVPAGKLPLTNIYWARLCTSQ